MTYYAGIDVSLEYSSVCVVDGAGKIMREQKIASEPEALIAWFRGLGFELERIGLEAGPLSQWLYAAMRAAGLAVEPVVWCRSLKTLTLRLSAGSMLPMGRTRLARLINISMW